MGKESLLKLSQRGPDAREEVPMRTPKRLYAEERIIYRPELLTCLHCGDLLVLWNYLAWDKTVQTFDGHLSIATRPGRCPHATCPGWRMRLLSAVAQRMAPPGSTYGYDVLVRIGWLRQHQRATYSEIHTELSCRFSISESHVRYLYQHVYLPLLACHERQQRGQGTGILEALQRERDRPPAHARLRAIEHGGRQLVVRVQTDQREQRQPQGPNRRIADRVAVGARRLGHGSGLNDRRGHLADRIRGGAITDQPKRLGRATLHQRGGITQRGNQRIARGRIADQTEAERRHPPHFRVRIGEELRERRHAFR